MAVRGSRDVPLADSAKVRELASFFAKGFMQHPIERLLAEGGTIGWDVESLEAAGILPTRNFKGGSFDRFRGITFEALKDTVLESRDGCFACPIRCKLVCKGGRYGIDPRFGGPEYETTAAFGSNLLVGDVETVAKAHELCNRYSMDTISAGMALAFAFECFENGILTKEDTGGIELRFGDPDVVLELLELIAFRKGIGDLLAEGSREAARRIGGEAQRYSLNVKGQDLPMHEPRGKAGLGLAYELSPTGADHTEAAHDLIFEEGKSTTRARGDTVIEVISDLDRRHPGLKSLILTPAGAFQGHLLVVGASECEPGYRNIPKPGAPFPGLSEIKFLPIPCGG